MLRNRPCVINWIKYYLRWRSFQVSVNGSLSLVADAASGVPQGSVLGPILSIVYVNDLDNNLTIYHLQYADDVKLVTPRKKAVALQSSLIAKSKWSEDWELILNPSKKEHLPFGDTSNPVTYSLTSRTSNNAQLIQTVSTAPELGLLLKTGFSPDDNVARTTKKARGVSFLPKADLRNPDPLYFTPYVRSLYSPLSWVCNTNILPHSLPGLPCARKCSKTGGGVCR